MTEKLELSSYLNDSLLIEKKWIELKYSNIQDSTVTSIERYTYTFDSLGRVLLKRLLNADGTTYKLWLYDYGFNTSVKHMADAPRSTRIELKRSHNILQGVIVVDKPTSARIEVFNLLGRRLSCSSFNVESGCNFLRFIKPSSNSISLIVVTCNFFKSSIHY